jgi:putative ATP-binding cassette transporter
MKLLELIRRESSVSLRKLGLMAAIAGLSNSMVLAIVNTAASHAVDDEHHLRHFLMFALAVATYAVAQRYIMVTSTSETEQILHRIRVRMAEKIRLADLLPLESIGRSRIYASITRETQTISQASTGMVIGVQSGVLVFFTIIYIAWLSLPAFFLWSAFTGVGLIIYLRNGKELNGKMQEAMFRENKVFDSLTQLLDGFKEVKMNEARGDDLAAHLDKVSAVVADLKAKTQTHISEQFVFSQCAFFAMIAIMVFVVPRVVETFDEVVIKTTAAVLFLVGPISNLVSSVPVFANATAACQNIELLEKELDGSVEFEEDESEPMETFEEICFEGVTFEYVDALTKNSFVVGPFNLVLKRGEVVFIAGGNGSGKSTFLRLLTALYYPKSGVIRVDGNGLSKTNYRAYRSLFSAVFSDYHLFSRLYGLDHVSGARIERLLKDLEIENKTRLVNGEFETLDLSTGQKKRLALLVSLLEDRPIYIFDEWAADQDPHFRRKFYEEVLRLLQENGKTVVAVTHDDRYFEHADRLLKMDEGRFVDIA